MLEHYYKPEDSLKRKAVLFLFRNVNNKKGLSTLVSDKINPIYNQIYNSYKNNKSDSVKTAPLESYDRNFTSDTLNISTSLLIENIDYAFKTRNFPWAKKTSFKDFCEYVLPYRIAEEPLSNWRKYFYEENKSLTDSLINLKIENPVKVCKILNEKLFKKYIFNINVNLPVTDLIHLYNNPVGVCNPRYILFTAMARSIGLPVAIDFTPQYSRFPGSHQWTTLISSTDSIRSYPFDGGEKWTYFPSHGVKMYRNTFLNEPKIKCNAELLDDPNIKDVTKEYPQVVRDLVIPSDVKIPEQNIYLFSFGIGPNPVLLDKGTVKNNTITFKDICFSENSVLIIGYLKEGKITSLNYSFSIQNWADTIIYYIPSKEFKQNIRLHRKYPITFDEAPYHKQLEGAKIQGSNQINFEVFEDIYTVKKAPEYFTEYEINSKKLFNYYRFLPAKATEINLSELHFLIGNKRVSTNSFFSSRVDISHEIAKVNDNDIRTNFIAKTGTWIGIDVSKAHLKNIGSIEIMPRNNFNVIEKNHDYELFYFDKDWKSLGKKVAGNIFLDYENTPGNCLFLLRDLTGGKQERIFTYEKREGKFTQTFW